MAGIDEFLKQYPELADKDPERLAAYVYDTQIKQTGKSQERFNEYFLGKQDKGLLGSFGDTIASGASSVWNAVKGDAEFDGLGTVNSEGYGNNAKVAMASMFGDDGDYEAAVLAENPDLKAESDKNGNRYLIKPDGEKLWINKPGLDLEDVTRFVGKALSFVPAAGLAGAAGKAWGLGARVLAGGGASAATDAAMQKWGAGREDIDGGQVAATGVLGGASEALAPAIGAVANKLAKRMGWDKWSKTSPERQKQMINAQLNKDGFKPEDFAGVPKNEIREFGEQRLATADLVSPEAALARKEFGYEMSRGAAMPKSTLEQQMARTEQLNVEEYLKTTPQGQPLLNIDANNIKQHDKNLKRFVDQITDGKPAGSRNDAAKRVHSELLDAAKESKNAYDDAYALARTKQGEFDDGVIMALPEKMMDRLRKSDVIIGDRKSPLGSRTPGALAVIDEIENYPQTTIEGIENIRSKINAAWRDAKNNPPDRRALGIIKDEFDRNLKDAVDNKLFNGEPDALDIYRDATRMYAEHMRKFSSDDEIGKVIAKMTDPERTTVEIADYLFGSTNAKKSNAARIATRYMEAVGENSEAFNALRETFFETVMRGANVEAKGIDGLKNTMKEALDGRGKPVTEVLFKPSEKADFRRFIKALETIETEAHRKNNSQSAAGIGRIVNGSKLGQKIMQMPVVKTLIERLEESNIKQQVSTAVNLPTPPIQPVSPTAITAGTYSNSHD